MNLNELKAALAAAQPDAEVRVALPEGGFVPAHFHVTEVGHIQKDFIDCGGKRRAARTCTLQTWMGTERDDGHRLTAGRFVKILAVTSPLFADGALPVEVEYEESVVSQFPLVEITAGETELTLHLGLKHTDCLARETCGTGEAEGGVVCCAGEGKSCC